MAPNKILLSTVFNVSDCDRVLSENLEFDAGYLDIAGQSDSLSEFNSVFAQRENLIVIPADEDDEYLAGTESATA